LSYQTEKKLYFVRCLLLMVTIFQLAKIWHHVYSCYFLSLLKQHFFSSLPHPLPFIILSFRPNLLLVIMGFSHLDCVSHWPLL